MWENVCIFGWLNPREGFWPRRRRFVSPCTTVLLHTLTPHIQTHTEGNLRLFSTPYPVLSTFSSQEKKEKGRSWSSRPKKEETTEEKTSFKHDVINKYARRLDLDTHTHKEQHYPLLLPLRLFSHPPLQISLFHSPKCERNNATSYAAVFSKKTLGIDARWLWPISLALPAFFPMKVQSIARKIDARLYIWLSTSFTPLNRPCT